MVGCLGWLRSITQGPGRLVGEKRVRNTWGKLGWDGDAEQKGLGAAAEPGVAMVTIPKSGMLWGCLTAASGASGNYLLSHRRCLINTRLINLLYECVLKHSAGMVCSVAYRIWGMEVSQVWLRKVTKSSKTAYFLFPVRSLPLLWRRANLPALPAVQ